LRHFASPSFWDLFNQLPKEVQDVAKANFELLKVNPRHPSLHFKKVASRWSARVGLGHRALGTAVEGGVLWSWIGTHSDYDNELR
jgi:hypothetical protein